MNSISLTDENGKGIDHLTQWDYNVTLTIEDIGLTEAPTIHFCNEKSERSLPVTATLADDGSISVHIPNDLLYEALTIFGYIFVTAEDNSSGMTVGVIRIPVRPKARPLDYEYQDSETVIFLQELIKEFETLSQEQLEKCIAEYNKVVQITGSYDQTIANLTQQADQATQQASQAVQDANEAIENTENATVAANTAASSANQATQNANSVIQQMQTLIDGFPGNLIDDTALSTTKTYSSQKIDEVYGWQEATDNDIDAIFANDLPQ